MAAVEALRRGATHYRMLALRVLSPSSSFASTRRILAVLVVLGVGIRIATIGRWAIVYDGAIYSVMGRSLLENGEFLVPYASGTVYYHHYPPLFPAYLALFYRFLGFSVTTAKLADLVLSLLLLTAVYATTADLLGRDRAWYAAAFVALEPMYLITTAIGYSESLAGLLFVITMWAVVKGLKSSPYLLLAGVVAGLAFLERASAGYVFILLGIVGLAWRVRFRGWQVFRDRWYLSGIGAFGVLAGGWALRNLARFGWPHWETSADVEYAYHFGLVHPQVLVTGLLGKFPWFVILFLVYGGLFLPELRRSLRRIREEETSALWVAILLIFCMGWVVSSFLWAVEQRTLWWTDNLRYVVPVAPVILWAALRENGPAASLPAEKREFKYNSFRGRFLLVAAAFLIADLIVLALPAPYTQVAAIQQLDGRLGPGDVIGVDGIPPEAIIPYVNVEKVSVLPYWDGFNGTYVLSSTGNAYKGFILQGHFSGHDLTGQEYECTLWVRSS